MTWDEAHEAATNGVGVEDLPGIMRELFDQCVGDALAVANPVTEFPAFIDALWGHVDAAFSLTRHEWPADAPKPWSTQLEELRGTAQSMLEGRVEPGASAS